MSTQTFSAWLIEQASRGDMVGQLAQKWKDDTGRGKTRSLPGVMAYLEKYLTEQAADEGHRESLLAVLRTARDEYRAVQNGQPVAQQQASEPAGGDGDQSFETDSGPVIAADPPTELKTREHAGWKQGEPVSVTWLRPVIDGTEAGWHQEIAVTTGKLLKHSIESLAILVDQTVFIIPWHKIMMGKATAATPPSAVTASQSAGDNVAYGSNGSTHGNSGAGSVFAEGGSAGYSAAVHTGTNGGASSFGGGNGAGTVAGGGTPGLSGPPGLTIEQAAARRRHAAQTAALAAEQDTGAVDIAPGTGELLGQAERAVALANEGLAAMAGHTGPQSIAQQLGVPLDDTGVLDLVRQPDGALAEAPVQPPHHDLAALWGSADFSPEAEVQPPAPQQQGGIFG